MARSSRPKFYAVAIGRDGPQIYEDWPTAERAVKGYKGAKYISQPTEREAKDWLARNLATLDSASISDGGRYFNTSILEEKNLFPDPMVDTAASLTPGFEPRLTTRYSPYPTPSSRPVPSSSRSSVHGIPPIRPPKSSRSSQPSSSQGNPIPISSDVEDELMITGFSQGGTVRDNVGSSTSSPPPQTSQHPAEPANHDPLPVVTDAPELSEEQKRVFKRIMGGESIFFTGSAGVGKSVLTRAVIRALREKYPDRNQVAVTATTGIAATNIGGCTLHSWAGLGLAKMSVDKLFYSLVRSKMKMDVVQRWKDCKVLIIDEVSMLHAAFFDKLEEIARMLRSNSLPFGGIQLVVTGDFFQLPPVQEFSGPNQPPQQMKFVFESKGWKAAALKTVVLQQVFRQRDNTFVNILNEMRMGRTSKEAIDTITRLSRKVQYHDGVEPTCLFAKRNQVLYENTRRLNQLTGVNVKYTSEDVSGKHSEAPYADKYPQEKDLRAFLDKNTLVEQTIDLKVGAQVMLVKNLQAGLVNGSIGRVIGFASASQIKAAAYGGTLPEMDAPGDFPDIERAIAEQYEEDESAAAAEQEWLASHGRLSHAASRPVKEEKPGESAKAPVLAPQPAGDPDKGGGTGSAPPLPPSLADIRIAAAALSDREKARLKAELGYGLEEDVDDDELQDPATPGTWPVVEFTNGQRMLLPPVEFTVEDANGKMEAKRSQVPLILAWALSIHKSQGQTIERVKVDLGDIFETGQAYVALSRATQLETLQVMRFYPNRVKAHPKVVDWYQRILRADES